MLVSIIIMGVYCCAGEVKSELSKVLIDLVARHQAARAAVSDAVVDAFFAVRPMGLVAAGKAT
jgi:hypothetical protein